MKLVLAAFFAVIIFYFFSKRKVEGVILLLITALIKFEVSFGSKVIQVYQIIGLLLIVFIFVRSTARKTFLIYNKQIFKYVLLFLIGISFSALVMRTEASFFGRLQMSFDYSILFFLTLFCIKDIDDHNKLIKGLHLGVFSVALIGIIGFVIGNPFFGLEEGGGLVFSGDYFENLEDLNRYGRTVSADRVSFSTSDPNSLGILMVFGAILSFFNLGNKPSFYYKLFNLTSIILFLYVVILSTSRTSFICFIILLIFKILKDKSNIFLFIFVVFITFQIAMELGYLEKFLLRFENSDEMSSGNGRIERWIYHFNHLNLEYILFGNSHTGFQGSFSKLSHTNYLALIYRGGILTFISFIVLLYKLIFSRNYNKYGPYAEIGIVVLIAGISQEIINSYGPNFIIWSIIASLAFVSKIKQSFVSRIQQ